MVTFETNQYASTNPDVNPNYLSPRQGLFRLQKLMDEYVAGVSAGFTTNESTLLRGLELMGMFREDLQKLAARSRHELLRCHELIHRAWVGEAHLRHMLHRKETRWPGFYYRKRLSGDGRSQLARVRKFPLRPTAGTWDVFTRPCPRCSSRTPSTLPSDVHHIVLAKATTQSRRLPVRGNVETLCRHAVRPADRR